MAKNQDIVLTDGWFTGEDKVFPWTIYQADGITVQIGRAHV